MGETEPTRLDRGELAAAYRDGRESAKTLVEDWDSTSSEARDDLEG